MKMSTENLTNLERELLSLKKGIVKMMDMVGNQLERAEEAFTKKDVALAKEIHLIEKKVNAADINLDQECENIIALCNPVASDLRFVLASLKIIAHLERVGDHADKIARYVRKKQIKKSYSTTTLKEIKLDQMFDLAIEMLEISTQAFIEEDSTKAREVFVRDVNMNEFYSAGLDKLSQLANKKDSRTESLLYLFSVVNKLERIGDLAKNIAEETIFYIEAKVLKHRKVKDLDKL